MYRHSIILNNNNTVECNIHFEIMLICEVKNGQFCFFCSLNFTKTVLSFYKMNFITKIFIRNFVNIIFNQNVYKAVHLTS